MVNYSKVEFPYTDSGAGVEYRPLPSGGIANDEVYETWYVYECPKCKRRVKEAYRCEVLLDNKEISNA